jgi:hypothetical protein
MKWVKCINTSALLGGQTTRPITAGKIYAVKETRKLSLINEILIDDDDNKERWYHFERFEDATAEVRDNKLNELGI